MIENEQSFWRSVHSVGFSHRNHSGRSIWLFNDLVPLQGPAPARAGFERVGDLRVIQPVQ